MTRTSELVRGPAVYLVEDYDALRESTIEDFQRKGLEAFGYATGEEFLAQWTADMRGVIVLDIDLVSGGGMNGDQVFRRLLALRSHLPVLFLTGKFADDRRLAVDLVRQAQNVDFCGKNDPPDDVVARIRSFLFDEAAISERATKERWLLELVCIAMTHKERVALDGALAGYEAKELARSIGSHYRVVELQRSAALGRVAGLKPLRETSKAIDVAMALSPLMERMHADSLVHLAAIELTRRLCVLDEAQQVALHEALQGKAGSPVRDTHVREAFRMMSLDVDIGVAGFKKLLKIGGKQMLDKMMPLLSNTQHDVVRNWLLWVSAQGDILQWNAMPDLSETERSLLTTEP